MQRNQILASRYEREFLSVDVVTIEFFPNRELGD